MNFLWRGVDYQSKLQKSSNSRFITILYEDTGCYSNYHKFPDLVDTFEYTRKDRPLWPVLSISKLKKHLVQKMSFTTRSEQYLSQFYLVISIW